MKAICSSFQETTEPSICSTPDMETNECLVNNGDCWQDKAATITACRDTFQGRVCECSIVQNVKFVGDGYTHCEATGPLRCAVNNGGCCKRAQGGRAYSACIAYVPQLEASQLKLMQLEVKPKSSKVFSISRSKLEVRGVLEISRRNRR